MPNLNAHCAISKQRTGFDFKELHSWIDEPKEAFEADHRILRHAQKTVSPLEYQLGLFKFFL